MNIVRWILFWPAAVVCGQLATAVVLLLGGLMLGHWWVTGSLVVAASLAVQPIVASVVAGTIAPDKKWFVAWAIWTPFLLLWFSQFFTKALLFWAYYRYFVAYSFYTHVPGKDLREAVFAGVSIGCALAVTGMDGFWKSNATEQTDPTTPIDNF